MYNVVGKILNPKDSPNEAQKLRKLAPNRQRALLTLAEEYLKSLQEAHLEKERKKESALQVKEARKKEKEANAKKKEEDKLAREVKAKKRKADQLAREEEKKKKKK